MNLLTLGLNHTSAPLDLRGRFAFKLDQLTPSLRGFRERFRHAPAHPEVALLSTCNRTELYCAGEGPLAQAAIDWLAGMGGVSGEELMRHAYVLEGAAAARHASRVASGLDSMVLGEPQILGQMKQAVREAAAAGTLGSTLHRLFQHSFTVAKEVRTGTAIGEHSVSMAAAALRLAVEQFGSLEDRAVLLIGAGEMIERVARHFASRAPGVMTVANRSPERAARLAESVGARTLRLADLPERLAEFDVVISSTASTLPIIGLGAVERALKVRRGRPMLMIDLAVPRDIEPEVARLPEVSLYTVDDLSTLVQSAGAKRHAAVEQAEAIVEAGVRRFAHWLEQRATVPLIKALQAQADDWRTTELARARRSLLRGETVDAVLEKLSRGIAQKMLHGAMAGLHASAGEHRAQLEGTVSRLFLGCPARNPIGVPAAPALCTAQPVADGRATRPVLRAVNGGRRST